jgi:Flp pilus assembly protein TadG
MSLRDRCRRPLGAARRRARNRAREDGTVAIIGALFVSVLFFGLAAVGVDIARWNVEMERVQKAADAAALAGVTFVPYDLASAQATALDVAADNGFTIGANTTISVVQGGKPSQLRVTISSRVDNQFGSLIGTAKTWITRTALADYTGPAPMGSPCNVFGNEPPSAAGSALPSPVPANCSATPQFWATMEGPQVDKVQGDRYQTEPCVTANNTPSSPTWSCASAKNSEVKTEGYFWVVHVEQAAVNTPIDVQLYDPAFVLTQKSCSGYTSGLGYPLGTETPNDYTTDGKSRYSSASVGDKYCSGDYYPGGGSVAQTTTFTMREQTDTSDPMKAPLISGCTKQFKGFDTTPNATAITKTNGAYNDQLSQVWHQWVSLCTFTPSRKGDWYLQVRTNVAAGGTAVPNSGSNPSVIYTGNSAAGDAAGNYHTGFGNNAFSIRAVPNTSSLRSQIAVSGFSRMPIFQNAVGSTATFNLIRALSNTRNQYIAFDFYDAADGSGANGGTVKVLPPIDATGSVTSGSGMAGCKGALNSGTYSTLTNCSVAVKPTTHDGQLQHIQVPIPNDYSCADTVLTGCWFRVQVTFSSGTDVSDITTWDANINGDPVRLIE